MTVVDTRRGWLVDVVDWRSVLADLVEVAPAGAVAAGAAAACRSRVVAPGGFDRAALLAYIVRATGRGRVVAVVEDSAAGDLDAEESCRVAVWLADTADGYIRLTGPAEPVGAPSAPVLREPGRLTVDESLVVCELPLLELAAELAAERPGGLVIRAGTLARGTLGVYDAERSEIVLDVDRVLLASSLGATFAHELAHALDPRGLDGADALGEESFADRLAVALLAQPAPVTLARARELAALVDGQRDRPRVFESMPAPGAASLMAFAGLFDRETSST